MRTAVAAVSLRWLGVQTLNTEATDHRLSVPIPAIRLLGVHKQKSYQSHYILPVDVACSTTIAEPCECSEVVYTTACTYLRPSCLCHKPGLRCVVAHSTPQLATCKTLTFNDRVRHQGIDRKRLMR
ncbi:hypothetical protein BD413DRAFT_695996 [Trametes elegans]|nr:hypothetical protein BD413DRAFT_695996 [Trametes elegans]